MKYQYLISTLKDIIGMWERWHLNDANPPYLLSQLKDALSRCESQDPAELYGVAHLAMFDAVSKMKIWLRDNHAKVDWSDLSLYIHNNNTKHNTNKKKSEYFGPEDFEMAGFSISKKNPVETFDLVLDESDGDLSVTINGEEYWWLGTENIHSLYLYGIENCKKI